MAWFDGQFAGKSVIVTGGGQGLGRSIAIAFARAGANVLISGRTREKLDSVCREIEKKGGKAVALVANVARREDANRTIAEAVDKFGGLDALVNNAQTIPPTVPIAEITEEHLDEALGSGIAGTLFHMQAALPHLSASKGAIVNMGSRQGIYGAENNGAYAAAKEGIRGLSRTAAREFGPFGIRVNVVCPAGLTETAKDYLAQQPGMKEMFEQAASLRRIGDPDEDVAPVVLYLCSNEGKYVTGQTINVDGGQVML